MSVRTGYARSYTHSSDNIYTNGPLYFMRKYKGVIHALPH